ncbi:sce7726 family protein [Dialister succinatiphilus]|jgi:hypothetical protein|uniref:sce7726 family protein n=1 Tax=Dialister succinatiphilus TaxID=487173 RepID=UPI002353DCF1|nr:sce7726 family protein [Dialister succinatiphilus]
MKGGKAGVLNRFFSDKTFRNLINGIDDKTYEAVIQKYLHKDFMDFTNHYAIQQIYALLGKAYRNEYFYKNTILNKLLLHVHSVRTTTALRELPIGKSKADFVLINGKAVVYEIKTELDNFERLGDQVASYYKAFDHVVVVTSIANEKNILSFKEIPDTVGIYLLQKNGYFKRLREPISNDANIDAEVLFKLLRKQEYLSIILGYYGCIPNVNQFVFYQTCKKWFTDIPLCISYPKTLSILKKRVSVDENAFKQVPYELKFLVYFMGFSSKDYLSLHNFLNSFYGR